MMFGIVDWSDEPAADRALRRALATCHPRLRDGLVRVETRGLALAGVRPIDQSVGRLEHVAGGARGPGQRSSNASWLLTDALASAGPLNLPESDGVETDPASAAGRLARGLQGDGAVAWWNAQRHELVLIRDAMGIRPIFYHHAPPRIAFASSLAALRAMYPELDGVDHAFVAHMLCLDAEVGTRTGWRDFRQVLPGGYTVLGTHQSDVRIGSWWRPELEMDPAAPADRDWSAELRQKLLAAIANRFPEEAGSGVASFLSGGLDSSSIVGATRVALRNRGGPQAIHTLSFRFPGLQGLEHRQSDETHYQDAVNDHVDATPHVIRGDLSSPLHDLDQFLRAVREPWVAPNRYLHHAGLCLASEIGASVIFDGIDGDSAISHGVDRFEELTRSLRWVQLLREARRFASNTPGRRHTVSSILREFALPAMLPISWRRAREIAQGEQMLRERMQRLSSALRDRDDVQQSLRAHSILSVADPRSFAQRHVQGLRHGIFGGVNSQLQCLAMAYGLRIAFPFFDRELLELSVVVPVDHKLHNGWSRYVLREAIAGLVPEEVRWRRDKSNLAPQFYRGLMTTDRPFAQSLLRRSEGALEQFVDVDNLRRASHDLFEGHDRSQAMSVLAVITLARWLELREQGLV